MDRAATPGIPSQWSDRPEDVIVAGGSVVAEDNRGGIKVEGVEIVYPTAHTLAVAAFRPGGTTFGPVALQNAIQDRGRRAGISEETAALAVAARATARAGAALGSIRKHGAVVDRYVDWLSEPVCGLVEAATLSGAAGSPGAASAANGLIMTDDAVADGQRAPVVMELRTAAM